MTTDPTTGAAAGARVDGVVPLSSLVEDAVALAATWAAAAGENVDRRAAADAERLGRLVSDPAGLRLAVASNSSHAHVDAHLAARGLLPLFDVVLCRDPVSAQVAGTSPG